MRMTLVGTEGKNAAGGVVWIGDAWPATCEGDGIWLVLRRDCVDCLLLNKMEYGLRRAGPRMARGWVV
jgi:hypothetical protein